MKTHSDFTLKVTNVEAKRPLLLALLFCTAAAALSQTYTYEYADIAVNGSPSYPNSGISGIGAFASPTVIPDFTWSITANSNKLSSFSNTQNPDEMPDDNPWETKYGDITTSTNCIKARHGGNASAIGSPLGVPLTVTCTFPVPTKAYGWGFLVLDIDVDEVDISALKPNGTPFSKAEINSWFKATGDADSYDGTDAPCWDAVNATVVGSMRAGSPCTRETTLSATTDVVGSYAYFEPNAAVKSITFTYNNLQATATPSFRIFLAAARVVSVSGTVFNDVNARTDNTINGTGIGLPSGTQLWAYLTNSSSLIVDSVHVAPNGTYTFNPLLSSAGTTPYNVIISTTAAAIGTTSPPVTLPAGWMTVGENIGTSYAPGNNDGNGAANQTLSFNVGSANITNVNFAVQQPPTAVSSALVTQGNPGGTTSVPVPSTYFSGSDQSGGTVTSIRITSFPSNATSITINGITYTAATFPAAGVTIPANASGNPTQAIAIDPIDGAVTSVITYITIDNGGAVSAPATVSVPFTVVLLLPLHLVSFTGSNTGCVTTLQWQTAEEQNTSRFEIELTEDGNNWKQAGTVAAHGTGNNNFYAFKTTQQAGNIQYRLKMVDADEKYTYSYAIAVRSNCSTSSSYAKIYPNPVQGANTVTLTLQTPYTGQAIIIMVTDIAGHTINSQAIRLNGGSQNLLLPSGNLRSGIYLVKLLDQNGQQLLPAQKLVKE